ncbi:MAG: hypothetical protein V4724_21955 [Pseudomonadota bacterium]
MLQSDTQNIPDEDISPIKKTPPVTSEDKEKESDDKDSDVTNEPGYDPALVREIAAD